MCIFRNCLDKQKPRKQHETRGLCCLRGCGSRARIFFGQLIINLLPSFAIADTQEVPVLLPSTPIREADVGRGDDQEDPPPDSVRNRHQREEHNAEQCLHDGLDHAIATDLTLADNGHVADHSVGEHGQSPYSLERYFNPYPNKGYGYVTLNIRAHFI